MLSAKNYFHHHETMSRYVAGRYLPRQRRWFGSLERHDFEHKMNDLTVISDAAHTRAKAAHSGETDGDACSRPYEMHPSGVH